MYRVPFLGVNLWYKPGLDYVLEVLAVLTFVTIAFVNREQSYELSLKQYALA